jgi:putative transposase
MNAVAQLAPEVGISRACVVMDVDRSGVYRQRAQSRALAVMDVEQSESCSGPLIEKSSRPRPPLALSELEQQRVLDTLNSERFADCSPAHTYATLLDEGTYIGSVRTMYRLLATCEPVRDRRNQLTHPAYAKPELLAVQPNEVWSWDITKLRGPWKWSYFHLYVILDIFSRYVVGWMIAPRESAELAEKLIAETAAKHDITPGHLTLHADRGTSMRSKLVAELLVDLDIAKTHSRPHVSDDNPYSEAQFKTLKYRPDFPDRFGSIEDARAHCQTFFTWYNTVHRHSGIGHMTPETVHYGRATQLTARRSLTLQAAFLDTPNRFKGVMPQPPEVPLAAWINPPIKKESAIKNKTDAYALNSINQVLQSH